MNNSPELCSFILTLKMLPNVTEEHKFRPMPIWWGRAAHALVFDLLREVEPTLAQTIHDSSGLRPFTVSSLLRTHVEDDGKSDSGTHYRLRITGITAEVTGHLLAGLKSGCRLSPGARLELDYQAFDVVGIDAPDSGRPWTGLTRYDQVAAPRLGSNAQPSRRFEFSFTSPTAFHQGGKTMPIPLPGLVFGSLLERWNTFAPIKFPEETRRYAEECLGITSFNLSSRPTRLKNGGLRMGAVGEATYAALTYDRYWQSVLDVLAELAVYAGAGMMTAQGFGQCRRKTKDDERCSGLDELSD